MLAMPADSIYALYHARAFAQDIFMLPPLDAASEIMP